MEKKTLIEQIESLKNELLSMSLPDSNVAALAFKALRSNNKVAIQILKVLDYYSNLAIAFKNIESAKARDWRQHKLTHIRQSSMAPERVQQAFDEWIESGFEGKEFRLSPIFRCYLDLCDKANQLAKLTDDLVELETGKPKTAAEEESASSLSREELEKYLLEFPYDDSDEVDKVCLYISRMEADVPMEIESIMYWYNQFLVDRNLVLNSQGSADEKREDLLHLFEWLPEFYRDAVDMQDVNEVMDDQVAEWEELGLETLDYEVLPYIEKLRKLLEAAMVYYNMVFDEWFPEDED